MCLALPDPTTPLETLAAPYWPTPASGFGGSSKQRPEDFVVEELPLQAPAGIGEHLYLWVEKRGWPALDLQQHIARGLEVPPSAIGSAGYKDTDAITRQWISVQLREDRDVSHLEADGLRILDVRRHSQRLRTGDLAGNRFSMRIRQCRGTLQELRARAQALSALGLPNYFDRQRFGRDGQTLRQGLALLRGQGAPRRNALARLALSAVQAALFNGVLSRRLHAGTASVLLSGDVGIDGEGGLHWVTDPPRAGLIPTGPMFGSKMRTPRGAPRQLESEVLAEAGLQPVDFGRHRRAIPGGRRPLWVYPRELTANLDGADLILSCMLPPGTYATLVIRSFVEGCWLEDTSGGSG